MQVGTCVITLQLYGVNSLKEKRRVLKPIISRLPKEFNISVAEVDHNDVWRTAVIGMAAVGNDAGYLHSKLEKAVSWIEQQRLDASIEHYSIEFR
ncbi:MAG TPA: DUF503 domain-containing protein [candidate division Zixibacteria bacterium]|nr:DUF503 domain-containing protein [candidate division Zixibacteria bacterium]